MPRRLLVTSALVSLLLTACAHHLGPHRPLGGVDAAGVIIGHTTDTATSINVETAEPGPVQLMLVGEDGSRHLRHAETSAEGWNRAVIHFDGLSPRTVHSVRAVNGGVGRVRTLPAAGTPVPVRIGFGSCMNYRQDEVTISRGDERVSIPAHRVWPRLAAQDLDAWAFIGDRFYMPNWYERYDEMAAEEMLDTFMEMHDASLALPGVADRLATVPTYVIYDDHDYGPNNAASDFRHRDLAVDLIELTYANPPMGEPDNRGCYFQIAVGPVDLFFLDGRYHRDSADLVWVNRDGEERHMTTPDYVSDERGVFRAVDPLEHMHGERQMAWLREGLTNSTADLKVVISGNQMLSNIHRWEAWYMYRERERFLDWLREAAIPGVVFVAGDRHSGSIGRLREGGPYPLYELTSSGLGVGVYPNDTDLPESPFDIIVPGASVPHWGVVEYDPTGGGTVTLRLEGAQGPISAVTIPMSALR